MPTKTSVSLPLNHGTAAAPIAAFSPVENLIDTPALLSGEAERQVLEAAKGIPLRDFRFAAMAKALMTAKAPAQVAAAMIKARYDMLGGAKSFHGAATTSVTACPDGIGYFRHFKGGSIYYHPYTGAHEVHGAIRAKWAEMGWERSILGYPCTDETTGGDTRREGRFSRFQGGSIYWHPATGAHEVHGAIRTKYLELGAEASFLGYPTTDETTTPDTIGRCNHFQAGSIHWTSCTWAHETHGPIRQFWAQQGWERNPQLGYPITDERIPHRGIDFTRAMTTVASLPSITINPVASHMGQSQDRYGDFENGVLFWARGSSAAVALAPRVKAANGAKMTWTGAEIAALAAPRIRQALNGMPGGSVIGINYLGTTGYSFDDAGLHNRAHRVHVILHGQRSTGIVVLPSLSTVEVHVEVSFDRVNREIVAYLTWWSLAASQGNFLGGGSLSRALHQRLDPVLWREFLIADVPATADDPIAVLSVKTQADGDVVVYFEP